MRIHHCLLVAALAMFAQGCVIEPSEEETGGLTEELESAAPQTDDEGEELTLEEFLTGSKSTGRASGFEANTQLDDRRLPITDPRGHAEGDPRPIPWYSKESSSMHAKPIADVSSSK